MSNFPSDLRVYYCLRHSLSHQNMSFLPSFIRPPSLLLLSSVHPCQSISFLPSFGLLHPSSVFFALLISPSLNLHQLLPSQDSPPAGHGIIFFFHLPVFSPSSNNLLNIILRLTQFMLYRSTFRNFLVSPFQLLLLCTVIIAINVEKGTNHKENLHSGT